MGVEHSVISLINSPSPGNSGVGIYQGLKGILGIRDLAKLRCGIRENAKYLDAIRDLTATREAGFAKI